MSRLWRIALGLALLASVVVDFWYPRGEAERVWDYQAFFAVYGFLGCVALVMVSRAFGKYVLQKPGDYYGEGSEAEADDVG